MYINPSQSTHHFFIENPHPQPGNSNSFCQTIHLNCPHTSDPSTRIVKRMLLKECPLDNSTQRFTTDVVAQAIKEFGNSNSAGPDGLTIHHLKNLGPLGLRYLTQLYNLSLNSCNIPAIWKHAIVVPIPKPNKLLDQGTSYRPISLLCPAIKVLERLLKPELDSLPLSSSQHGFRSNHSTVSALLPLAHKVAQGFNQPCPPPRTLTMAIDLTKAFDMVNHTKLIRALSLSSLSNNTKRWLSAYLKGRTASCRYNSTVSRSFHSRAGVPQGACLSPTLFNIFVSTFPQSEDLLTSSYADDFTISCSNSNVDQMAESLSTQSPIIEEWASERALAISAPKSTITLFTPQFAQSNIHPQVTLSDSVLPLERNPCILGVTFDPHFKFNAHVKSLVTRALPRINILKALTGTNWGQQKETILITYKSLIRSLFMYAAPIWFPNTSPSLVQKLQTIQNSALRIATGCVRMASVDHLHEETEMLPVQEHLSLICSQYLARALQPTNPSHDVVTSSSGSRDMKQTLQSRFLHVVAPHLSNGVLPPAEYGTTIKSLHTGAVAASKSLLSPNRVLQTTSPQIAPEETNLPRPYRSTLSQLRSSFCSSLHSYRERIGLVPSPLCPSCGLAPHTTVHVFSCSSHPTPLTELDLWERPRLASEFLSSLPFFDLPSLPPPPPEPPPDGQES